VELSGSTSDIPQEDLERLAVLTAAIPKLESSYGTNIKYELEAASPSAAKVYRRLKQGTGLDKTLSVGVSQLNAQMLSDRIRNKYFKNMSDTKIERKLARNADLSAKITFENYVDNYRRFRDNPAKYGNSPEHFWYALAKSHQSPNFFLKKENADKLAREDVSYSNALFDELHKYQIKPAMEKGGKLSDKISILVNEGYPQKQAVAIAYDMQRKGKLVNGGTLEPIGQDAVKVNAHNPGQADSVELEEAYVDHDEVIARLKDIGKYVFPADTINPITGNPFAKDAERITKANAAAEAKPYDKQAQAAIQRNNETLSNYAKVNEMLKGIETGMKKLKKGGKLCMECGGKMKRQVGGPLNIADLINQEDLARTGSAQAAMEGMLRPTPKIVPMFDNVANGMDLPWGSPYERQFVSPVAPLPTVPLPTGMPGDKVYSQPSRLKTITPGASLQGAVDANVAARNKEALDAYKPVAAKANALKASAQMSDGLPFGLGEGLQLGELAAKAALMLRGYDKQPLHQASSPITQASYDPTRALQEGTYAYNAAADQVRNTTSRSGLVGNIQQLGANAARTAGATQAQYDQMNRQARTQYEQSMAAREQQNLGYRLQNEQVRQQDEAQFFNNIDTLLTSVGNYGRSKVGQQTNQKAVQLLLQAFPDIAKYINV